MNEQRRPQGVTLPQWLFDTMCISIFIGEFVGAYAFIYYMY